MPDLAPLHPIIVHFVIALGVVGIAFRWISLTGRAPFTGPAAAALALLAGMPADGESPRVHLRRRLLTADAYGAAGHADSARVLEALRAEYPTTRRVLKRLEALP